MATISISYNLGRKLVGRVVQSHQLNAFFINLIRVGAHGISVTIPADTPLSTRLHIKGLCETFHADIAEEQDNVPVRA